MFNPNPRIGASGSSSIAQREPTTRNRHFVVVRRVRSHTMPTEMFLHCYNTLLHDYRHHAPRHTKKVPCTSG
jgi:hypothetical protein